MTNLGGLDRGLRAVAGIVLVLCAFLLGGAGVWQYVVPAIGVVLLVTAAVGFCPAYRLLGIRTCKVR